MDTYGSPRIHIALNQSGAPRSLKHVVRIMQEHYIIFAKNPRICVNTVDSNHGLPIAKPFKPRI